MVKQRASYWLELLWLFIAIATFIIGVYKTWQIGIKNSYMLFIMTAIATIMYNLRRYIRKRQQD